MNLPLLLALCLSAAPAPDPLQQLQKELASKRCDEAFALVSQVKVPEKRGPDTLKAARAIVRDVVSCREDAALALALTELAARLAPDEPDVLVAHVESLIAVSELEEAGWILEGVLAAHTDHAAARQLKAELAEAEAKCVEKPKGQTPPDDALVQARRLEEALQKARQIRPPAVSSSGGRTLQSFPETVELHGDKSFVIRGLTKGQQYIFRADGECKHKKKVIQFDDGSTYIRQNRSPIFGVDFRVQFGSQEQRQIYTGEGKPDHNDISFVAERSEMSIHVFDQSSVEEDVECALSGFSVAAF